MDLTRKEFLLGGLSVAAAPLGIGPADGQAAGPAAGKERGYRDAILRGLPSDDRIWAMERRLAGWAPHFTCSPGHVAYSDMLAGELAAVGIDVRRQTFRIPYWEPHRWALSVDGASVPVTGYRPHSGPTGPDGVEGALALPDGSDLAGKIVLIDVAVREGTPGTGGAVVGLYPERERAAFHPGEPSPLGSGMGAARNEDAARAAAAGAAGAIYVWEGISDANAQDQMQPFFGPPTSVPTLWVGGDTGRRLKAKVGTRARLTMHATVHPDTPTDTIWGVLPGASDEVVIVNTHSDGCNACEENGGIAVVSLARALAALPAGQRRKTYVFLTTGHFSHGFIRGAESWQKENPELMRRAVACLTIEHLGATEWRDDAQGRYRPTGKVVWANAITPTAPMTKVIMDAATSLDFQRVVALKPAGRGYPGEGASFWAAKIPTLSYIVGPDWTMAAPKGGELDKISRARMLGEIKMFARCLERIDDMDKAAFGIG